MKRSFVKGMSMFAQIPVASELASAGCELTDVELEAVHGGELKIEVPAYIPMSQSHPKTEVVLPRVPYK